MMRRVFLLSVSLFLVSIFSQKLSGQVRFFYCKVEEMNFPEGLDSIGHNAIYGTALAEIILPNTVKKLGNGVFSKNEKLKKVVLPEGIVQKILL